MPDSISEEVKKLINKTKRKRDELDLEMKKVTNEKLIEASNKLENVHVILESTLIRMVKGSDQHNKKLKTKIDELKRQLESYQKSQKLRNEIKSKNNGIYKELCSHCTNSTKIFTNFHNLRQNITAKHPGKELSN